MADDVPPAIRKIIMLTTARAVARCKKEGVALEDFYRAMLFEQEHGSLCSVPELFRRTFVRLQAERN